MDVVDTTSCTGSDENWARKYCNEATTYAETVKFSGNIRVRKYIQEAYHSFLVYFYNLS